MSIFLRDNRIGKTVDLSRSKIVYLKAEKSSDMITTNDLINSLLSKRATTSLLLNMLLKNILATVAVVGLVAASPVEVEDLEARAGNYCHKESNAWCCTTAFPFNAFFIQKVGSGCERPSQSFQTIS